MDYTFLGSISACHPRGFATASPVTTGRCAETQIGNAHRAFCCPHLWDSEKESHLQRLLHLCRHRGVVQASVLRPATQSMGMAFLVNQVSQVSNSPALLMFCSGINVGQAPLMGPCAHFKCKLTQSLKTAKGRILVQSF